MAAYYNEIDPYAAQWLRNLIAAGHIAPGDVDERSIVDVRPACVAGYAQCHFFAGIGGWSVALRLAGWPDNRPVWTGSCPCQPFSAAGQGKAADDERHLWPQWASLIAECRPGTVFGEQVEAAIGWGWLDAVFADLEAQGYACGAAVLPACGVGAPHIRQRLWWVADACGERRQQVGRGTSGDEGADGRWPEGDNVTSGDGSDGTMADRHGEGRSEQRSGRILDGERSPQRHDTDGRSADGNMEYAPSEQVGLSGRAWQSGGSTGEMGVSDSGGSSPGHEAATPLGHGDSPVAASRWADCDWLPCRDGKARPVEPGTFPLAHGIPGRVGRLRAYGNAIVPQVAAEFIGSFLDASLERAA